MSSGRSAPGALLARAARSIDPAVAIQIYVVALIASPAVYVVGPLGAAGTPATLVGCGLLVMWVVLRLSRRADPPPSSPIRTAVGIFSCTILIAFAFGTLRPTSPEEISSSVRGLISVASWCGVVLFTLDSSRAAGFIPLLARTITAAGTAMAALGIVQFFTGIDYVQILHLPGLVQNASSGGLYIRSGFMRVSGTALHSIEFAAVLSICLPIAMYFALAGRRRPIDWLPPALMFMALLLTVSRSGAIGLGFGLMLAFLIADRRQRWFLIAAIPVAFVAMRIAIPGLVGTISDLFLSAGEDQSVGGRVDDYAAVAYYIQQSPFFGRGPFTFMPGLYRVLDNQYLATLIEAGAIGLIALIGFVAVPIVTSLRAAIRARERSHRAFGFATAASIAAAATLSVTFDMFGFPTAMGMTCVIIGLAAAIDGASVKTIHPLPLDGALRWFVAASAAAVVVLVPFALNFVRAEPVFEARGGVTAGVATVRGQNIYDQRINSAPVPDILVFVMRSDRVRAELRREGVEYYELALSGGSLAPFTDALGVRSSEQVTIAARADSVEGARQAAVVVREKLADELESLQAAVGVRSGAPTVVLQDSFLEPEVFQIGIRKDLALVGALAAATVLTATLANSRAAQLILAVLIGRRGSHRGAAASRDR